jgi:hypothetical protein
MDRVSLQFLRVYSLARGFEWGSVTCAMTRAV